MKLTNIIVLFLLMANFCNAQNVTTRYFKDENLRKEVDKDKASFIKEITTNEDGIVTTEIKNIKKNSILLREAFKGEEPFGFWVYSDNSYISNKDYNFELNYKDTNCAENSEKTISGFENNDSINYIAPKISSKATNIYEFLGKNIEYPVHARENGITGKVKIRFTITKSGTIENISIIKKSPHVTLDKEAVRVIRLIKLSSNPLLKGKPIDLCVDLPISFMLN